MPHVDLVSGDDYVSIWYTTNTRYNSVSTFDPTRPTVILLHPFSFDSSWLGNILGDPGLDGAYNMIAFDLRYSGKTRERPNGKLDCWVQAADLGFACEMLHVFQAHVWAEEALSVNIALRFAMLFPDMCLSLALVTASPPAELQNVSLAMNQFVRLWCFADDLSALDRAASKFLELTVHVGLGLGVDEIDEVVAHWQTQYPPFRRARVVGIRNLILNRVPLTKSQLATICQPVLILHGENNTMHPLEHAQQLKEELVNSKVTLSVIEGAAGFMSISPSCAPILSQNYVNFLDNLLPHSNHTDSMESDRMNRALARLGELAGDPGIIKRDPSSPMSFSLVPPDVEREQTEAFNLFFRGMNKALSPLRPDGRPEHKPRQQPMRAAVHGYGNKIVALDDER
ncbi:alpha/beta-hydrolase [Multifurca ochricompacta]|uniref:Alpha/beta-hydrolase n=1 Tax=Multifurca ochricompacta TaxID=376703 RepID=A0AAD4M3C7_9AGAM|nr:alpha/beta-hydrolase [Multifurca ochricompacta]